MEGSATKISFSLDSSKLKRARPPVLREGANIGSKEDVHKPEQEHRQYVVAVSDDGKIVADASSALPAQKKLIIPVPSSTPTPVEPIDASVVSPVPLPAESLDERAARELLDDLMGRTKQQGSALVIAQQPVSGTSAVPQYVPSASKHVDKELLNKLFAPNQKRVKGDGSQMPLLLRNRPVEQSTTRDDKAQLMMDLKRRADDIDIRDDELFERVPIEEFGAAVLRGMGVDDEEIEKAINPEAAESSRNKKPFTREKLGVGASSNPLLALKQEEKNQRLPRRPGDPSKLVDPLTTQSATTSTKQSKADLIAAIRARKFPGITLDACVRLKGGPREGTVGIITQTDGVPGLEKCRIRVFVQGVADDFSAARRDPAAADLVDTEEIIVGKALCVPLSGEERPSTAVLGRRLKQLQTQFRLEKEALAAAQTVPAAVAADAEAVGVSRTETIEESTSAAHHTGEPAISDEVRRTEQDVGVSHIAAAPHSAGIQEADHGMLVDASPGVPTTRPIIPARPIPDRSRSRSRRRHRSTSRDSRHRRPSRSRDTTRDYERKRERDDHSHHKRHRRSRSRSHSRERRRERDSHRRERSPRPARRSPDKVVSWLYPGISVRVVDESQGRYFRMKGIVHDVVAPGVCTIRLSLDGGGNKILDQMRQSSLATALPKPGGRVLIIRGQYKGTDGTLLERKAAEQITVVQLHGDYEGEIAHVLYDDVAELNDYSTR